MRVVLLVLVVASVALALVGGYYLTQVTAGVGAIAAACFLGIMARLVQASMHHREAMESSTDFGEPDWEE